MPPGSYNTTQKSYIAQFTAFTQASDRVAARFLKSHNWNVEQAVDAYFQNPSGGSASVGGPSGSSTSSLSRLFDQYRDPTSDPADTITVNGAMKYFTDIKVELEEITVLVICEALKSPTIGEFARDGFIEGWKALGADTLEKQRALVPHLRKSIQTDQSLFKRVYRNTFLLARNPGQKAVALDTAIDYWNLFFRNGSGLNWNTASTPWLDWYIEYVQERWKKTVNRDMWNMTLEFVLKSTEDETLSWWEEAGAWPGVLDEFVHFVNEKREKAGKMEVE
ncbi:MAG: Scaffold-type E3 ligase [Trichoglossum hirsutum]|nr:MAG: Scaffold-type E3 ligase [Trichoglossum hirsutum]